MMGQIKWLAVVVMSIIALGAVIYHQATQTTETQIDTQARKSNVIQCERGNKVRAWLRWDVRLNAGSPVLRTRKADTEFPILDCEATEREGRNVPLSLYEQRVYIEREIGPLVQPEPGRQ